MSDQKKLPEHLENFIAETPWTFAKTYARTWPHEYIVREKVDAGLFDELAAHIENHGYESHFYETKRNYFDYGGNAYWHMDNIINRCPGTCTFPNRQNEGREFPWPAGPWRLSLRFLEAVRAAVIMFADKTRKGCRTPYISHLFATCAIALENGAGEDEAIAALLHDAIEDIEDKPKVKAVVGLFGPEVLRIVEECSDADTFPKPPWRDRKERYIARLAEADASVLLVSAADKLHNARAIAADLRRHGPPVWERFSVGRDEQLWYYRELVDLFRKRLTGRPALVDELESAVSEIERERD